MPPKPQQLDLFDRKPQKDDQELRTGSPEEVPVIEVHSRSPTDEDSESRIKKGSKERATRLREMSRVLSKKFFTPGINQD